MDATLLCSQWLPIRSTQQHTHNTLLITLLLCSFFFISDTYNKPQLLGLLEAFNTHTHSDKFTIIHHHQLYQCFLYTVSCPLTLSKTGSSCNTVQDTSTTGRGVGLLDMSYSRLRTVIQNRVVGNTVNTRLHGCIIMSHICLSQSSLSVCLPMGCRNVLSIGD